MKYSELEEKRKNNCENILHMQKKVVSLQCQNKEIKNKTKTKKSWKQWKYSTTQ